MERSHPWLQAGILPALPEAINKNSGHLRPVLLLRGSSKCIILPTQTAVTPIRSFLQFVVVITAVLHHTITMSDGTSQSCHHVFEHVWLNENVVIVPIEGFNHVVHGCPQPFFTDNS